MKKIETIIAKKAVNSKSVVGLSAWEKLKKNKYSYIMLAPFAIMFTVFVLVPVLASIALSFSYFNMLQAPRFIGLTNYVRLFLDDDVFLIAIKNTMLLALITGPLGYILSFIFAWFINEFTPKVRAFSTLVFYAPSLASNIYFIWLFIFSGDIYGYFNSTLIKLGIIRDPVQWLINEKTNMYIVVVVIIWLSMGAGFLSFIAGLQTINRDYYEAAAIDGIKNRWQELWFITLPQMVPQLLFGAVMSISASFSVGYQSMALTGFPSTNYSTHTVLLHMLDYGTIRFEMGYASAIAVVLFALMLTSWKIVDVLLRKLAD